MFDLKGKGALVTGASGGIGAAIARVLHGAGAQVALSGTRVDRLEALAGDLGEGARVVAADLADRAAAETLARAADEALGGLDIVVNNAGLTRDTLAMRMKAEDWDRVLAVDLTSAFLVSQGALRGMMKRRWGRIINITSVVAATGNPGQVNYAAAKAGLTGMSKALAQEVASRGITVNCVAPGFIATAMTEALTDGQREGILGRIPAGRMGAADDVAACVMFLASEEAAYITGQTLHVNGGMAML